MLETRHCPYCGAPVPSEDWERKIIHCEYCDMNFTESELDVDAHPLESADRKKTTEEKTTIETIDKAVSGSDEAFRTFVRGGLKKQYIAQWVFVILMSLMVIASLVDREILPAFLYLLGMIAICPCCTEVILNKLHIHYSGLIRALNIVAAVIFMTAAAAVG